MQPKLLILISFILLPGVVPGQDSLPKADYYRLDSISDRYILKVNEWVRKTDSLILNYPDRVQADTLEVALKNPFTLETEQGNYIKQNPYSRVDFKDYTAEIKNIHKIIIYSADKSILKITDYDSFKHPSGLLPFPSTTPLEMYFDNNKIIFSKFGCSDPTAFIGSCGGTYSVYLNYFLNNAYYDTFVEGHIGHCGCGLNYIIAPVTLESLVLKINDYLIKR